MALQIPWTVQVLHRKLERVQHQNHPGPVLQNHHHQILQEPVQVLQMYYLQILQQPVPVQIVQVQVSQTLVWN